MKSKVYEVKDMRIQRIKVGDWTWIYDSDRISGATDMGTPAWAHGIGTPS
jgi:hypothetical protein